MLLKEGSLPSYMMFTRDELSKISDSFFKIFGALKSSTSLLMNTLRLNVNVIASVVLKNEAWLQNSFKEFEESRKRYASEMAANLEFFNKVYNDKDTEGYATQGFVAAVNPLMWIGFNRMKDIGTANAADAPARGSVGIGMSDSVDVHHTNPAKPAEDSQSTLTSPRVERLIQFFGFNNVEKLNESAQKPEELSNEKIMQAQNLAKKYVAAERSRAQFILKNVGGYISVTRDIGFSKSFDELARAIQASKSRGVKLFDSGIEASKTAIEKRFQQLKKSDPQAFKKLVAEIKKASPELKNVDDVEALTTFSFGVVKSELQAALNKSYASIVNSAASTIDPKFTPEELKILNSNEIGKDYLRLIDSFRASLKAGKTSLSA